MALQLGIYRMLGEIHGLNISQNMKVINTPRNSQQKSGVANIYGMSNEEILQAIDLIEDIKAEADPAKQKRMQEDFRRQLGSGGITVALKQQVEDLNGAYKKYVTDQGKTMSLKDFEADVIKNHQTKYPDVKVKNLIGGKGIAS